MALTALLREAIQSLKIGIDLVDTLPEFGVMLCISIKNNLIPDLGERMQKLN